MFKTVAFVGWSKYGPELDMCTTVPWPELTNEAMSASLELSGMTEDAMLVEMGFPEAVQLMHNVSKMRLRASSQGLDEFVFNHEVNVTREEILAACINRIDGLKNDRGVRGPVSDDEYVF